MTQSEVAGLLRTAIYVVVGIPIPAGAAAAVFFLPHSRLVQKLPQPLLLMQACKCQPPPTPLLYLCRHVFGNYKPPCT